MQTDSLFDLVEVDRLLTTTEASGRGRERPVERLIAREWTGR